MARAGQDLPAAQQALAKCPTSGIRNACSIQIGPALGDENERDTIVVTQFFESISCSY